MKKLIETKRAVAAVCIFTIVLLTFPGSAIGWDGCVLRNAGDIFGLEFPFGDEGLPLVLLPGMDPVHVTYAVVQGSGKEKSFITPFDQYIYQTKLVDGWGALKKGRIIAYTAEGYKLVFKFNKVRLYESFFILDPEEADRICAEGIDPVVPYDDVSLYLEVKKAKLVGMPGVKFDIILKIEPGVLPVFLIEIRG